MLDFNEIMFDPWLENIVLASIPFYKYDSGCLISNASGCIVDVNNKKFLLSISHSDLTGPNWVVEIKANLGNGQVGKFKPVGQMKPLAEIHFESHLFDKSNTRIVDFTYCMVDSTFTSYHTLKVNNSEELVAERTIFKVDRIYLPSKEIKYGFFGHVNFKKGDCCPTYKFRLEPNLRFVGKEDDLFIFKLDHSYGSHKDYLGCSGAPIIDENNNIAAIVSYGDRKHDLIYGIDIRKYISALIIDTI